MDLKIFQGDCRDVLKTLEPESVHCVVTSPPYWGLRDYGLEPVVWEGPGGCGRLEGHEWGDTITVNETNHTDKRRWQHTRNGRDEEQPIEKRVAWLRTKVPQGQFCRHCNAWRGSLGLEPNFELYVEHLVTVFREVRRVLRQDGTLWLNLGDAYFNHGDKWGGGGANTGKHTRAENGEVPSWTAVSRKWGKVPGLKPKDLVGIPWRVAFALQEDGWYLRSDIIWAKPNPMPESVKDRPTKSHEYVFMSAKSERYYYDVDAIKEPASPNTHSRGKGVNPKAEKWPSGWSAEDGSHAGVPKGRYRPRQNASFSAAVKDVVETRNKRSVWTIPTQPFPEAHFAVFPEKLVEPCILAGCPEGGTVLDPFLGAGTVAVVAERLGRQWIGIEAKQEYVEMAQRRIDKATRQQILFSVTGPSL